MSRGDAGSRPPLPGRWAGRILVVDDEPGIREICRLYLEREGFDLLALFVTRPRRVLTRNQLLDRVWDLAFAGDTRTVDVHVQRLRRKIEPDPQRPRFIKTVWSVGYRFDPAGEEG